MSNLQDLVSKYDAEARGAKHAIQLIHDTASTEGRKTLSAAEERDVNRLFSTLDTATRNADAARSILAEETVIDQATATTPTAASAQYRNRTTSARIGSEPRTYSRDNDPDGKGTSFLTDVIGAFRGNPQSTERLARHAREYEVDNKGKQTRAAGDVTTGALPNLVIPQYLVDEYAAKPSNARPFADICRHVDLPDEGMQVQLAKGNTSATAALQTTELVAVGGGNFDADPLTLQVQTAEAWQLVSRQAIDRGRVTEQLVTGDMLDQVAALIDSTLLTQATTGLYDSGTRITYDSASPTVAELYPFILQGASKVSQALLNRGNPSHVVMHPRRWFWMQSLFSSTWPMFSQPGVAPQMAGSNTANAYANGPAGVLPSGLQVVMDNNVQTTALTTAQTGGTQDVIYVVPQSECVLLESPNREVFIRAEAPAAPQLGVMLVTYEYFTYTFQRYSTAAFQRINGTGTVPPAGF